MENELKGIEKTERIVPLMHSAEIGKIALALSKAQGEMGKAHKDSTNPFFKSKYADLESVMDACREALSINELAVFQTLEGTEFQSFTYGYEKRNNTTGEYDRGEMQLSYDSVKIITTLAHSSGQWMKSIMVLKTTDLNPQGFLSTLTYARRGALSAMVGIVPSSDLPEADDDGETAVGRGEKKTQPVGDDVPFDKPVASDVKAGIALMYLLNVEKRLHEIDKKKGKKLSDLLTDISGEPLSNLIDPAKQSPEEVLELSGLSPARIKKAYDSIKPVIERAR